MAFTRPNRLGLSCLTACVAVLLVTFAGAGAALAVGPAPVTGLASSTHPDASTWYSDNSPRFTWDPMSAIAGYSYVLDQAPGTVPPASVVSLPAVAFASRVDLAVGPGPASVAVADLNGDGKLDMAVADKGGSTVSVLLGDGAGGFSTAADCTVGGLPHTVVVGHLNKDAYPDLVVTNRNEGTISVLLGHGDGSFAAQAVYDVNYSAGSDVRQLATGDFNGDGRDDVAVAAPPQNAVYVLLANADGTLQAKHAFPAGGAPEAVATGDFNADGHLDLAVTDWTDGTVSILLGDGQGGFAAPVAYAVGKNPHSVAVGDFNVDGKADLAVADWGSNTLSVLLGGGDGSFSKAKAYIVASVPSSVTAADFNGDGKPDLAVTDWKYDVVSVLLGAGDGTFDDTDMTSLDTGDEPMQAAAGDFDGDGLPDLAVAHNGPASDTVGVLLDRTAVPPAASYTLVADGLWYFHIRAVDALGNGSATTTTRAVRIDTTPPVTTDDAPGSFTGPSITVKLTPTDGDSGMGGGFAGTWYKLDGASSFAPGTSVTVSGPGTHTLRYYSKDAAGNTEATATRTIDGPASVQTFTITAAAGSGGSISPFGALSVDKGSDRTFSLTPDAHYHVADVVVDGLSVGPVASYTFTNVSAAHTIAASFAIDTYTITATAGAHGAVSAAGANAVPWGSDRTFSFTPDAHYHIADVLVDGVSVGAVGSYAFNNIVIGHTIEASFAIDTFDIVASSGPNGTVTPPGTTTVDFGGDQTYTITPAAGYSILDVLVDGVSNPAAVAAGSYTFTNVQAAHTISATFAVTPVPWNVTLTLSKSSVDVNHKVKFSGNVAGGTGSAKIQRKKGSSGSWSNWKTVTLNGVGNYSITVKMTSKGTFYFRTMMASDSGHTTSYSAVKKLKVH